MLTRLLRHPLGLPAGTLAITLLATATATLLLWIGSIVSPWWPVPMSFALKLTMLLTMLVTPPFAWALLLLLRRADGLQEQLLRIAAFDELTGVYTRRQFTVLAQAALERLAASGAPAVLLAIDADWFKAINDRYGHAGGDAVLRLLGQLLRTHFGPEALVGRFGGEEFLVLLPGAEVTKSCRAARALRERVAGLSVAAPGGESICFTISIGVAGTTAQASDLSTLQRIADDALYRAKHEGRDRVALAVAASTRHCPGCVERNDCRHDPG